MYITLIVAAVLLGVIYLLGRLNAPHLSKDTGDRRLDGTTLINPSTPRLPEPAESPAIASEHENA